MATLKFFEYKGVVGATSDVENGKFINDINDPNNMGVVVDVTECTISQAAKDILLKSGRERGSVAPLMLTNCDDGTSCVAVFGFERHLVSPSIGRICDVDVLHKIQIVENDPPADFIEYVDSEIE